MAQAESNPQDDTSPIQLNGDVHLDLKGESNGEVKKDFVVNVEQLEQKLKRKK